MGRRVPYVVSPCLTLLFVLLSSIQETDAWSPAGHQMAAIIAYREMPVRTRTFALRLLERHPQFADYFGPPDSLVNDPRLVDEWRLARAASWPDSVIGTKHDRPSWRHEPGASVVLQNVLVPEERIGNLLRATMNNRRLHLLEATLLCRAVLADPHQDDSQRAIALCWLLHLIANIHHPCFVGSLYSRQFPEGDENGGLVRLRIGDDVQGLWDRLPGDTDTFEEVLQRVGDLDDLSDWYRGKKVGQWASEPDAWIEESRRLSRKYVYTGDLRLLIKANATERVDLPGRYLEDASRVAMRRINQAGSRAHIVITFAFASAKIARDKLRLQPE